MNTTNVSGPKFTVGRTIHTTWDFPYGIPCILHDGDSVWAEFPCESKGMVRARTLADLLNGIHWRDEYVR